MLLRVPSLRARVSAHTSARGFSLGSRTTQSPGSHKDANAPGRECGLQPRPWSSRSCPRAPRLMGHSVRKTACPPLPQRASVWRGGTRETAHPQCLPRSTKPGVHSPASPLHSKYVVRQARPPGLPAGDGAIPVLQGQLTLLQLHNEPRQVLWRPGGTKTHRVSRVCLQGTGL